MKAKFATRPALFPCPVVLVTCTGSAGKPNAITLAWVGIVCSEPPALGIGVRPSRYSCELIESSKEFVVNIPTVTILKETDFCGQVSGRDMDKFQETGLTPEPAEKVKAPLIKECPVNMECVVTHEIPLGSHKLFIGNVICVHVDQNVLNKEGKIDFARIAPFAYNQNEYWSLGKRINLHGFSKGLF